MSSSSKDAMNLISKGSVMRGCQNPPEQKKDQK